MSHASSDYQIHAPANADKDRYQNARMKECTYNHSHTEREMDVVEHFEESSSNNRQRRCDDASHEEDQHCSAGIYFIEEQEVHEIGWACTVRMPECHVGMQQTVDVCEPSGQLMIPNGSLKW